MCCILSCQAHAQAQGDAAGETRASAGETGAGAEAPEGSGGGREGDVDVAEMVGQKEDKLHLKQLVEAHHITMP